MGRPAEKPRRATYADLQAVPPNMVAEIINGNLQVFPRPSPRHTRTTSRLGAKLTTLFDFEEGGPGGWHILDEPELHLGPPGYQDVLVPDIGGWRVERMPELPETAYFSIAPDWVCENLSSGTEATDRIEKMPIYAREGVRHAWLIHPTRRTFEVFALDTDRRWKLTGMHRNDARVRAAPFEQLELELAILWTSVRSTSEEPEAPAPASKPKRPRLKHPSVRSRKK